MDFKQLHSFISVVRCRSFTEAAEELGISQPTISTHIRILEEELNSRLIVRTAKSFEVTPRGMELFECAQNILKLRDDMVSRWNGHDSKVIRLGVSTIPSAYILPEVLPTFGKSHDDIYFVVTQSDSRGIIDAVHKGSYDLGLVGMKTDDEQLVFKKFYQDHLVLIASVTDYFLEMKDTGSFSLEKVLQEQPVILREQGSGTGKSASAFLQKIGIPEDKLHIAARINDQEAIKNLVAGGLGVSIVSEKAVHDYIDAKRLLQFELPGHIAGREFYIIYHKDFILKDYVCEFIKYLEHCYKQ